MDLVNVKEDLPTMQLLAVCIFQSKEMDNETAIDSNHRQYRNKALEFFNDQLSLNLRYSVLEIRKNSDNCKKKTLKRIALLCRDKHPEKKCNPKFEQ